MVSSHVMAIYLKWHMCPCHEPLVTQISIHPSGEYIYIFALFAIASMVSLTPNYYSYGIPSGTSKEGLSSMG